MRLPDIVNQIRRRVSEGTNLVRHPVQAAYRVGRRRFQRWYEGAAIPGTEPGKKAPQAREVGPKHPLDTPATSDADSRTPIGVFTRRRPRSPTTPVPVETPTARNGNGRSPTTLGPQFSSFPAASTVPPPPLFVPQLPVLQPGEVLQGGWWGRYTVGNCLQDSSWIRLYEGIAVNGEAPVWICEYLLLEETFNQREAAHRLDVFRQLINQNLRLGNGSDFRIVKLKDVTVDARNQRQAYLITSPVTEGMTLATQVSNWGALSPQQVRQVLYQVLQSLQYLHTTYRVRWLDDRGDRGLIHGNLSLDTLWIRWIDATLALQSKPFFIYLSRFALWEHVFWPPGEARRVTQVVNSSRELGKVTDDLADLGTVAFALLTGQIPDETGEFEHGPQPADSWPSTPEAQALKPFILKLMGLDLENAYRSVDVALTALRALPEAVILHPEAETATATELAEPHSSWPWLWVGVPLVAGMVAAGGLLGYLLFGRSRPPLLVERCRPPCTLRAAASEGKVDASTIHYAIQDETSWMSGFTHFVGDFAADRPPPYDSQRFPLERLIEARSTWNLNRPRLRDTGETSLLEALDRGQIQFALIQDPSIDTNSALTQTVVARDAIVFFVVFSDENRFRSTPKLLDGTIELDDLIRLYGQPSATLSSDQAVKLYFPQEDSTVELLKGQLLIQNLLTDEAAAAFDRLWEQDRRDALASRRAGEQDILYARMLRDFELAAAEPGSPEVIGIGFDRLSKVFGQCSVYPLALETGGQTYSPLVEANGQPITPKTDLCGDKGSYWANTDTFKENAYPFTYDLSVVYPACEEDSQACEAGQTFAAMMQTPEGQYLLSEVGLVPLERIEKLNRILWSRAND